MDDINNVRFGPLPRKPIELDLEEIMDQPINYLAKNLKAIREFLGITQDELGKRCGFPASHISHFETGNREPNIRNLIKLAKGLGVTTDRLLQE